MFFLELNHYTLTIWYQIDQCHFAYITESLVPYLWLCGLLTQTSIFSTSYQLQINGRKAFHRTLSFSDNAIVRDFCPKKFHSKTSKSFKDLPPTWREFAYDHLRLWNHAQPKWSISKFLANKLNVADHFHAFLPVKVDLNPANIEAEDS